MSSGRAFSALNTRLRPRPKSIKPVDRLKYWKIIRGDEVIATSGKESGKAGRVIEVNRKLNTVLISGLNLVHRHVPMSSEVPSGRVQKEMPIHVSNVALINPETGLAAKVDIRKVTDPQTGVAKNRRFVHGTNIELPRPRYLEYQDDWKDSARDTLPEAVRKMTFQPTLAEPPMPPSVLDELRGRYSFNRKRKERIRRATWMKEDEAAVAAVTAVRRPAGEKMAVSAPAASAPSTA